MQGKKRFKDAVMEYLTNTRARWHRLLLEGKGRKEDQSMSTVGGDQY